MQEHQDEIVRLLFKLAKGEKLYPDEQQLLDNWIAQSPHNKKVFDEVTNEESLEQEVNALVGYDQKFLWHQIQRGIHGKPPESRLLYFFKTLTGRVAAVVVLVALGVGVYIIFRGSSSRELAGVKTNSSINTDTVSAKDIIQELANAAAIALSNASIDKMINEDVSFYNTPSSVLSPLSYNKQETTDEEEKNNGFLLTGELVGLEPLSPISNGVNGIERGIVFAGESYGAIMKDATKSIEGNVSGEEQRGVVMETGLPDMELNPNYYMDEAGKRWISIQNSPARKRSNKINILHTPAKNNGDQKVSNIDTSDNVMQAKDQSLFPLD